MYTERRLPIVYTCDMCNQCFTRDLERPHTGRLAFEAEASRTPSESPSTLPSYVNNKYQSHRLCVVCKTTRSWTYYLRRKQSSRLFRFELETTRVCTVLQFIAESERHYLRGSITQLYSKWFAIAFLEVTARWSLCLDK